MTVVLVGCATEESQSTPSSIRTGSGGRGMSPAQEAETARGATH